MKQRKILFCTILVLLLVMPQGVFASKKNYFENPENIYGEFQSQIYNTNYKVQYAFLKEAASIYSDCYGSKKTGTAQKYSGIMVVSKTNAYVQVIYKAKRKYKIGWMKRDYYKEIACFYNGEEKQLVADGTYQLENKSLDEEKNIVLKFEKNQKYQIKALDKALKIENGRWELIREYDHFYIKEMQRGKYLSMGKDKHLKLVVLEQKMQNVFGEQKEAAGPVNCRWSLKRLENKNVNPYRNFLQYDPDWAANDYGNVDNYSGKMAAAGCGVVAITNAVYALNGQFIDPMLLADYAVEKEYRILGSGTDDGIFPAAASRYGEAYGFYYVGKTNNTYKMRDYLKEGCVAISHVPGHYVTVADYNEKKEKYLVLDSHPIAARPTGPFGNWFSAERLEKGGLTSSDYYIFSPVKNREIYKKAKNISFIMDLQTTIHFLLLSRL